MAMEQIEVKILDRTFKLQVPPNEKPRLMNAVRIVDQKMREIRDASLAHGVERIAVNAALQITYEFLGQPLPCRSPTNSWASRSTPAPPPSSRCRPWSLSSTTNWTTASVASRAFAETAKPH